MPLLPATPQIHPKNSTIPRKPPPLPLLRGNRLQKPQNHPKLKFQPILGAIILRFYKNWLIHVKSYREYFKDWSL